MRLFSFLRDMGKIALVLVWLFFCIATHWIYVACLSARKRVALVGLDADLLPYVLRLEYLAWRLRNAADASLFDHVHHGRIRAALAEAKTEACVKVAASGFGIARWRLWMLGI